MQKLSTIKNPIFFSYSNKDRDTADAIVDVLEDYRIPTWIAHRRIEPGTDWDEEIGKALVSCRAGIFLLTQNSSISKECKSEWRYILKEKKPLFLLIKNEDELEDFPYRLNSIEWINLDEDFHEGMNLLINAIKKKTTVKSLATEEIIRKKIIGHLLPSPIEIVKRVRIILKMAIDKFIEIKDRFIKKISEIVGIAKSFIRIITYKAGSTIVTIELPSSGAVKLVNSIRENPDVLSNYNYLSAKMVATPKLEYFFSQPKSAPITKRYEVETKANYEVEIRILEKLIKATNIVQFTGIFLEYRLNSATPKISFSDAVKLFSYIRKIKQLRNKNMSNFNSNTLNQHLFYKQQVDNLRKNFTSWNNNFR